MKTVKLTSKENQAVEEFLETKNLPLDTAVTFGDVAIPEEFSTIRSRSEIDDFRVDLIAKRLALNIPFITANMETVTGPDLAIAIEREGGLGILPQSLPLAEKLRGLEKIRRSNCAVIENPITVFPSASLRRAKEKMAEFDVNSAVVVGEDKKPVGILTNRDWFYEEDGSTPISSLMTKNIITAPVGTTFDKAGKILKKNKIEKLPLVDKKGRLAGLITAQGLFFAKHHKRALRDGKGQFIRAGSIGVGKSFTKEKLKEAEAQIKAGVKLMLIDTARALSANTEEAVLEIKKHFPNIGLMVGNVSTPEGAKFLFDLGVDVVKVGQGPGQACTTRMVGVGIPQLTAVAQCAAVAKVYGKTIVADGGIKNPGDIAKALIAGASAVMIGKLFAGTIESAGEAYPHYVKELGIDIMAKDYEGSASFSAQKKRVVRGDLDRIRRPEGVDKKIVPVIGPLKGRVDEMLQGLRSGMSYVGAKNIKDLQERGRFVFQTNAGLSEGIKKF